MEAMPSEDRSSAGDALRELDALPAAAKSFQEQQPSRSESLFHPDRSARRQAEFATAVVAAVKAIRESIQDTSARLTELEGERLSKFDAELEELRREVEQLKRERADSMKDASDRAAELREQLEKFAREQSERRDALSREQDRKLENLARDQERSLDALAREQHQKAESFSRAQSEKIEQLSDSLADLGREVRERIQNVLDEQRVAIRQLSLKASEDAVLSDRARRAAEAKLEDLAKRVPPAQK
jgi:chromosome segregation ATPase